MPSKMQIYEKIKQWEKIGRNMGGDRGELGKKRHQKVVTPP